MVISTRMCPHSTGENEHCKSIVCKPPDAPLDVSPKSVSSFDETIAGLSAVPVFKSHKRQRSDAMVENSPAQEGFLVRRSQSAAEAEQVQSRMDTDDMCKPRAVYPVNFKAPKVYDSPRTRRSMDLEIPSYSDWSPAPSPSFGSSCHAPRNFNAGPFHKRSFDAANGISSRRLSRHRSRPDGYNCSLYEPQQQQQEEQDEEEEEHSQISIDLERISLAAPSASPFSPSRPTLRPSPLLPVVFSPIQVVAYRKLNTVITEGKGEEEEEEDLELVLSLPVSKEASTSTGSTEHHYSNSHTYHHHQHLHHHHKHKNTLHHLTSQPSTFNNNNNIDFSNNRAVALEDADLIDADMLIFNMDV